MTSPRRSPGRPRTEGLDERILDATVRLIDQDEPVSVNAIVAASGVSRASIYRRWSSLSDLMAEALDEGRVPVEVSIAGPIKEALWDLFISKPGQTRGTTYTDRRFRKRIELLMSDPALQQNYWESKVQLRRESVHHALQVGINRGEIRPDINIPATIDAIYGVFYYQVVVRGVAMTEPDAVERCAAAFNIVWRGIEA